MWPDNETERDFLNFTGVADTVAEIIVKANGRPVSIGVSGAWGVGKSSMIKLIRRALEQDRGIEHPRFVFVEFNAWLYQGYDDARAALLEAIATTLVTEAEKRRTGVDRAKDLLKRVDWLRVGKLGLGAGLGLAFGVPPVGLVGEIYQIVKELVERGVSNELADKAQDVSGKVAEVASTVLKPKPEATPSKEIEGIRQSFEATLAELDVKLVVLIDDLDRCLPSTTISTLEAIRLFLFLNNAAFVIAADDAMIKHAVRSHFQGIEDESLVTSYFDKLIQIPIRVPPLGTQEVRAYMMLLYVDNSELSAEEKETFRVKVCDQLQGSWKGHRVDRAFMQTLRSELPGDLGNQFDAAERLAPLMASTSQIAGNPRLIKRFLNALSIRMSIARAHSVGVDEAVLAKLMLFERCGNPAAYSQLVKAVVENDAGCPAFLAELEDAAHKGELKKQEVPWDDAFVAEWLTVSPRLAGLDLRGALYVSREHAPLILPEDRLSSQSAEILTSLLDHPEMAFDLRDRLTSLPRQDLSIIMRRILERARQEQEWGAPPILTAALVIAEADQSQSARLSDFLLARPRNQIKPAIVPKISSYPWAGVVLNTWAQDTSVSRSVKSAIREARQSDTGA